MVFKKETVWVVLADGASARIYEQVGQQLTLLEEFSSPESHKLTRELVSDRPGRTQDRSGLGGRHSMEPRTDPQDVEKEKFIRSVATHLNTAARDNKVDVLTICAPPRVLGELRQLLDKHAKELIKSELGKDLIKIPLQELPQHLAALAKE